MSVLRIRFLFLNLGHFLTHYLMLVFATVAALRLGSEWGMTYAQLIPLATPGFVAFGVCALPAGWLADRWSREGMMAVFFIGLGASAVLTGLAESVAGLVFGLTCIGVFAAIYHPVGLAMVVQDRSNLGVPLAVNGVFGNLGVAFAALASGYFLDRFGWRSAYLVPGVITLLLGCCYLVFEGRQQRLPIVPESIAENPSTAPTLPPRQLYRVLLVILLTTALGGMIFQSTTFSLPKVFAERLDGLAAGVTDIGAYAFLVFAIAALAQLAVGYLIDHYSLRRIFLCVALLQVLFFTAMIGLTGLPALFVAIAFMLLVFGEIPISDVLVGRVASGRWRSRAYALSYLVGFGVSASSLPLIAWVHSRWGFDALFGLLAIAAVLIFCVVLALPNTDPSRRSAWGRLALNSDS